MLRTGPFDKLPFDELRVCDRAGPFGGSDERTASRLMQAENAVDECSGGSRCWLRRQSRFNKGPFEFECVRLLRRRFLEDSFFDQGGQAAVHN